MKKISVIVLKIIEAICMILLVLVFSLITVQVVCRFTPLTLTWTEELARICFVTMSFLAAPLCLAEGAHVAVDMLVNALPAKLRRVIEALVHVLVCVFSAMFIKSMLANLGPNEGVKTVTMSWFPINWVFAISAIQTVCVLLGKEDTLVILEKKEENLTEEDLGL